MTTIGTRARSIAAATPLAVSAFLVTGCVAAFGGTEKTHPPTLGRQLMDLKTAYDKDAITEEQFLDARSRLLSQSSAFKR